MAQPSRVRSAEPLSHVEPLPRCARAARRAGHVSQRLPAGTALGYRECLMDVLIVSQAEVPQLLPMGECIDVMERAFRALARGEAILPLRPVMWLPEKAGALGMMPSFLGDIQMMGLKAISVFPGNHGTPYDSHQGVVML